jgi:hypothetical protein
MTTSKTLSFAGSAWRVTPNAPKTTKAGYLKPVAKACHCKGAPVSRLNLLIGNHLD